MSDFDFKTLGACIVLDIVDTISDFSEQAGETVGFGGGVVEAGFDTLDAIQVIVGIGIFYLLQTSQVMHLIAVAEPVLDEGIPLPLYTAVYLYSVFFMEDSKVKK